VGGGAADPGGRRDRASVASKIWRGAGRGDGHGENCHEVIEFLAAYVDGELSEDVRFRFDAHVAACPECSAYLKSYEATVKLAKAALSGSRPTPCPPRSLKTS